MEQGLIFILYGLCFGEPLGWLFYRLLIVLG